MGSADDMAILQAGDDDIMAEAASASLDETRAAQTHTKG